MLRFITILLVGLLAIQHCTALLLVQLPRLCHQIEEMSEYSLQNTTQLRLNIADYQLAKRGSHELLWHGEWYDIMQMKMQDQTVLLRVHLDKEEAGFVEEIGAWMSHHANEMLSWFLKWAMSTADVFDIFKLHFSIFISSFTRVVFIFVNNLQNRTLDCFVPPPN